MKSKIPFLYKKNKNTMLIGRRSANRNHRSYLFVGNINFGPCMKKAPRT